MSEARVLDLWMAVRMKVAGDFAFDPVPRCAET